MTSSLKIINLTQRTSLKPFDWGVTHRLLERPKLQLAVTGKETSRPKNTSLSMTHKNSFTMNVTSNQQQTNPTTMESFLADPIHSSIPQKQSKRKSIQKGAKKGEPLPGTPIFLRVSLLARRNSPAVRNCNQQALGLECFRHRLSRTTFSPLSFLSNQ